MAIARSKANAVKWHEKHPLQMRSRPMLLHAPSNPITKARSRCTKSPPAPYCCKATCPLFGRKLKGFEKHGKKSFLWCLGQLLPIKQSANSQRKEPWIHRCGADLASSHVIFQADMIPTCRHVADVIWSYVMFSPPETELPTFSLQDLEKACSHEMLPLSLVPWSWCHLFIVFRWPWDKMLYVYVAHFCGPFPSSVGSCAFQAPVMPHEASSWIFKQTPAVPSNSQPVETLLAGTRS